MRVMKDSGIGWIGCIPENWKCCAIKHLCNSIYAGGTPDTTKLEYWNGDIPWLPSGACKDREIHSYDKTITKLGFKSSSTKLIPKNTTIIAMTGATCSQVGYTTFETCANQSVTAFIENETIGNSKYLFYSLIAAKNEILTKQSGGAQAGINVQDCKNILIPNPDIYVQKAIADFLDNKCSEIDALANDIEKQIEVLEDYKKSVITEAVTKGLEKNVKIRNSGSIYANHINKEFVLSKLKFTCKKITDGSHFSPNTVDLGEKYITAANVLEDKVDLENSKMISDIDYNILVKNGCRPLVGDILLTKDGSVGRTAIVTDNRCVVLSSIAILSVNQNNCNRFIKYSFDSQYLQKQMFQCMYGSALKRITLNRINEFDIVVPSLQEQLRISDYLDNRCAEIKQIIKDKQKQLKILADYKKALIYEYVTGKKEVIF